MTKKPELLTFDEIFAFYLANDLAFWNILCYETKYCFGFQVEGFGRKNTPDFNNSVKMIQIENLPCLKVIVVNHACEFQA